MKKTVKLITAGILLLSLLILCCACSSIGKNKIDVSEFIEITYEGYNGHASCQMTVDYDGMNKLVDAQARNKNLAKIAKENEFDATEMILYLSEMESWIRVSLAEGYENLSNGDKVTVVVEVDEHIADMLGFTIEDVEKQLEVNFKSDVFEVEVEGLEEITKIDILASMEEYLKVPADAISGELQITDMIPHSFSCEMEDFSVEIDYYPSPSFSICHKGSSVGNIDFICDTLITSGEPYEIKVEVDEGTVDRLASKGYEIYPTSKTYTAPQMSKRITLKKELSAEKIQQIKAEIIKQTNEENSSVIELKYLYFGTRKDTSTATASNIILAAVNVKDSFFGSRGVYVTASAVIDKDGKFVVDAYDYETKYEEIEEKVNNDKDYTFESLI